MFLGLGLLDSRYIYIGYFISLDQFWLLKTALKIYSCIHNDETIFLYTIFENTWNKNKVCSLNVRFCFMIELLLVGYIYKNPNEETK